jgi:hypothetical protein
MYDIGTGVFQCSPTVHVMLHPAHNPFIAQSLQGTVGAVPISVNLSLLHSRAPLPLGPFTTPVFLDYILASGAHPNIHLLSRDS